MGIKLSELEVGFEIKLKISSDNSKETMEMKGVIKSIVKSNIAIIDLDYPTERRLNFDNVNVDLEYCQDENVPILWRDVKIAYYKGEYVLQAPSDGRRHNRRGCFRVGVSVKAPIRIEGKGTEVAMIRDVSLSGYSISDRRKELNIDVGDKVSVKFEDSGHNLNLVGIVVRTEEREDMVIYGLEICNICKDLSSYISVKQRHNRT